MLTVKRVKWAKKHLDLVKNIWDLVKRNVKKPMKFGGFEADCHEMGNDSDKVISNFVERDVGCPGWVVAMTLKSWGENREKS